MHASKGDNCSGWRPDGAVEPQDCRRRPFSRTSPRRTAATNFKAAGGSAADAPAAPAPQSGCAGQHERPAGLGVGLQRYRRRRAGDSLEPDR
jgi:hypothetical protein